MRKIILFAFICLISTVATAQKISYDIPEGFEQHITKEDYKMIVDIAIPAIKKRYTVDSVRNGSIYVKDSEGKSPVMNLDNLMMRCIAAKDKSAWKDMIEGHFENLFISFDEQKKIDPKNYETIKKYLSIRIYPTGLVAQRGGISNLVAKIDLEGTYSLLMLDLPGAFTIVDRESYLSWKKDSTEVFRVAQDNVNKQEIQKVTQQFDIDKSKIEISFLGNEDYAASYALDLMNNSPDLVGEWGTVLAMPNKGLVDLCKVDKAHPVDFVKFIQRTKPLVEKSFQEHPQSISDQYFWYYKGKFTRINILENENGSINVISPMGLSQLMTEKK